MPDWISMDAAKLPKCTECHNPCDVVTGQLYQDEACCPEEYTRSPWAACMISHRLCCLAEMSSYTPQSSTHCHCMHDNHGDLQQDTNAAASPIQQAVFGR